MHDWIIALGEVEDNLLDLFYRRLLHHCLSLSLDIESSPQIFWVFDV